MIVSQFWFHEVQNAWVRGQLLTFPNLKRENSVWKQEWEIETRMLSNIRGCLFPFMTITADLWQERKVGSEVSGSYSLYVSLDYSSPSYFPLSCNSFPSPLLFFLVFLPLSMLDSPFHHQYYPKFLTGTFPSLKNL